MCKMSNYTQNAWVWDSEYLTLAGSGFNQGSFSIQRTFFSSGVEVISQWCIFNFQIETLVYGIILGLSQYQQTTFAIVSMMRLTGVEISNKPKCAKQTAISKSFKML